MWGYRSSQKEKVGVVRHYATLYDVTLRCMASRSAWIINFYKIDKCQFLHHFSLN